MPPVHEEPQTIEREIRRICSHCSEGLWPRALRSADGRILWVHEDGSGAAVECAARDLQPWLAIARRRASARLTDPIAGLPTA